VLPLEYGKPNTLDFFKGLDYILSQDLIMASTHKHLVVEPSTHYVCDLAADYPISNILPLDSAINRVPYKYYYV